MREPSAIRDFARAFVRAFVGEAKSAFTPSCGIEIVEQDDTRLVLRAVGREIVVNKRYRTVKSGQKVLARFDSIRAIEVAREHGDDGPETWKVSLYLSWWSRVHIGWTDDATDASIVGAHLSTVTGKKVIALP